MEAAVPAPATLQCLTKAVGAGSSSGLLGEN